MKNTRRTASLVGALFLIAMFGSLVGGALVDSIISVPDFYPSVAENRTTLIIGVLLEMVNAIAVVGMGALLFPVLKQHSEEMAVGYLGLRIVEAVFCSVIVVSPISLLSLGRAHAASAQAGAADAAYLQSVAALSMADRASSVSFLIPIFWGLAALVLYTVLYRTRILPRFIPIWGFIATALIFAYTLLAAFGVEINMTVNMILAFPIIVNEIVMGIWLIAKGFRPSAA